MCDPRTPMQERVAFAQGKTFVTVFKDKINQITFLANSMDAYVRVDKRKPQVEGTLRTYSSCIFTKDISIFMIDRVSPTCFFPLRGYHA
jgi:hypothetical protein